MLLPQIGSSASEKNLGYVQALRGVAALSVVLWHASRFLSPYGSGLGTRLFGAGGVMGVDLFFIISGFIIVHTTRNCDGTSAYGWNFLVKRFARIWPLYIFWTCAYVAIRGNFLSLWSAPSGKLRLLQSLTFIPFSNGGSHYDYPALSIGWTINYEVYFYLVWGLGLFMGRARWIILGAWFCFTLLVVPRGQASIPLTLAQTSYELLPVYLNIVCDPIVWLFVAGALVGLIAQKGLLLSNRSYANLAIAAGVGLVVWQYCSGFRIGHGIALWGLSLIPFFLILTLTIGASNRKIFPPLVYLGDISYSLYLVHPLVQEELELLFVKVGLQRWATGWPFLILTTLASIGLATLSYKFLERRLSNQLRDALKVQPATPAPSTQQSPQGKVKTFLRVRLSELDAIRAAAAKPANIPFVFLITLMLLSIASRLILIF